MLFPHKFEDKTKDLETHSISSLKLAKTSLKDLTISIIIPTLNEAENLVQTLKTVQDNNSMEVIVVDGGSWDDTVRIAKSLNVRVISSTAKRSDQMNLGAALAKGDILLFLHADTHLPLRFEHWILQTLAKPNIIAGAFELKINSTVPALRWVEWGVKLRSHLFQMPYGDQAIFLRASIFQELGGFPDLPIMEDFELMRRLKQRGRIKIAPAAVITSNRRWKKLGVCRTTLINQLIIVGYLLGISPERLLKWYRNLGKQR
ncbi:TIGR04283 family arsenosugar biosynthesis glycosyltransferase [Stenomitos frigidus]|uniref:4,4'-diaponeurosporenoate glycosyltransferase n=1 Tax=Stenomitos frigidus AS-A4 TaxID=2933935 RepID=A0ABV0KJS4_9CYAN